MPRKKLFTPGPWSLKEYDIGNMVVSESGAEIAGGDCHEGEITNIYDASLICAAPDLLKTAEDLLLICEKYCGPMICGKEMTEARKAIAKAYREDF